MGKFSFQWICLAFFIGTHVHAEVILTNLNLIEAENIALDYNKPYLIANQDVEQARARNQQAVSRWFPTISFYTSYTRTQKNQITFNQTQLLR